MKKKTNIAQPIEEKLSAFSGVFKLIPLGFSKICLCRQKTKNVKENTEIRFNQEDMIKDKTMQWKTVVQNQN